MSTRQKSFFEQDNKRKPWNSYRNSSHADKRSISCEPNMINKSAIAPSTQAKSKLKSFQFMPGGPENNGTTLQNPNKENEPLGDTLMKRHTGEGKEQVDTTPQLLSKTIPPSTPATRLPLADLIGNIDHHSNRQSATAISPDDQLVWQAGQSPLSRAKPAWKSKKRARSSSPVSSQSDQGNSAKKEMFDMQKLGINLNTPQADPAAELWSRYAGNSGVKATPTGKRAPVFAHLINDSSPHPSESGGSVGGLRRWASCGDEWPASRSKRRKTTGVFREEMKTSTDNQEALEEPAKTKKSKTGLLLERIQETLGKQPQVDRFGQCPSSSSPLPETKTGHSEFSSPLQRIVGDANTIGHYDAPNELQYDKNEGLKRSPSSSSEYGDMDIDVGDLENIENAASGDIASTAGVQARIQPVASSKLQNPQHTSLAEDDEDDFSEFVDDEDIFAADMEHLASMYDSRPQSLRDSNVNAAPAQDVGLGIADIEKEESEDEFGEDIDEDQLAKAEMLATQAFQASTQDQSTSRTNENTIQRYVIKHTEDGKYTDHRGNQLLEKTLVVENGQTKVNRTVSLREAWFDMDLIVGGYINVIGEFDSTGRCIIDNSKNMLILHPDTLISAVVVATSFACTRRAVLEDRIKATSEANEASMYGKLLHELFQEALKANCWNTEWLLEKVEAILPKFFESLVELNLSLSRVLEHVRGKLPEMQGWAEVFVRATPQPDARVKDRNGKTIAMAVNKLLDVEEHVWSPMYGLKGNIDATVQVVMDDDGMQRTMTVPFEIKTGRNHHSHIAQTALYTLLLSDRYDLEVVYGILYYLNSSETSRVSAIRNDLIHIVIQRNKLACAIRERFQLPPMLVKAHQCGKCFAQKSCFLYNKLSEEGTGKNLSAREKFDELVRYLKPVDQEFFQKWDLLLTKEEGESMKFANELWTMTSQEREKIGRCFSNVIIEPGSFLELADGAKISRFQYSFIKSELPPGFSFNDSQIAVGEPIVISDEYGHFALAKGYVTRVRRQRVTVAVDRQLHNIRRKRAGFDATNNQVFAGIMEVAKEGSTGSTQGIQPLNTILYRLDKDDFSNGMALVRNNLLQIMDETVFRAAQLRSLIVHGDAPKFKPTSSVLSLPSTQLSMNLDQQMAVEKVMAAQDYALVLGMPGTGKTTTIAHIIRALVAKGKSVLLTSYQHSAVDNILLKLQRDEIKILRLGSIAKIHPEVQEFAILDSQPKATIEELRRSWEEPRVVATTCLGINHPLFAQRTFDYCIVDEASQITLPVCLGPIRMAKVFVLVGDHYQLPPLVQNEEAVAGGLNVSLFKMLSEKHEDAVVSLTHQYRMCSNIMEISNRLIYSGRLVCGTDTVANRQMHIAKSDAWHAYHYPPNQALFSSSPSKLSPPKPKICLGNSSTCFLARALDPLVSVIFLNTDSLFPHSQDVVNGPRITNSLEASIVTLLTTLFLSSGVSPSELGIVTFYRSQIALLRQRMRSIPDATNVEMSTADRYQGRDKEAIIVSLVRSNSDGQVGDLLKDWRRINVAVTRAQSKLIIIGSKRTMTAGGGVLAGLVGLCEENGWIFTLPKDAVEGHMFDDGTGTQLTGSPFKSSPVKMSTPQSSPAERSPIRKKPNLALCPSPLQRKGGEFRLPEKRGQIRKNVRAKTIIGDILESF